MLRRNFLALICLFLTFVNAQAELDWQKAESEHFIVIYLKPQEDLVPHVVHSAEKALTSLMHLFNYNPSEKIIIVLRDFSDYGSAGATTVPHSLIRLEIEPLEPGYENTPYTERIQWLLSHELVHVVVNDLAAHSESFARAIFSKVPPEKDHPLSVFYSLLTNYNRYTPGWYQEGIAVFLETWLNGGFGRLLGNFDEMYFRSMVFEHKVFPSPYMLDSGETQKSFLLNTLNYLYGTRFIAFVAAVFGVEKLLSWYNPQDDFLSKNYEAKFKNIFGMKLLTVWNYFILTEKRFQNSNLKTLRSAPLTQINKITSRPMGWVTQPYFDPSSAQVIFGSHQPDYLTALFRFDIKNRTINRFGSLPSPSLIRIASTAYDHLAKNFFYTTKNSELYRDIRILNTVSKKTKILFKNVRVGDLTVSSKTKELWGIRHSGAKTALVYSAFPYETLKPVIEFERGDVLHDLSVSPSGRFLAATLHQATGRQAIIVTNLVALKNGAAFTYQTLSEDGSPEFPSWHPNENIIYWNAFTNGVSNIYQFDQKSKQVTALSHTLRGLFRPVFINEKSILAFEFTTEGFVPVTIPNRPAVSLPAIDYFGQKIIDRNPQVTKWGLGTVQFGNHRNGDGSSLKKTAYSGISQLKFRSFIPIISGFQNQKVVGFYTHIADPLQNYDFTFEVGIPVHNRKTGNPKFHFKGKYEYNRQLKLAFEHNASSFYDLFNKRKSGFVGTKALIENTHYWKFDNPHKIKQTTDFTLYTGIEAINDNLIKVTNPDFVLFESGLNSRSIRKAIGSVDNEFGNDWTFTLSGLLNRPEKPQLAGGMHAEWNYYTPFAAPHNILHFQFSGGVLYNPKNLAIGNFYFGGFGNREIENKQVKQFREIFRFPGVPVFSINASSFAKVMLEHNFPPVRFRQMRLGQHLLHHVDASWFAQGLLVDSGFKNKWFDLGAQINFVFEHWFNLESTLSAGVAQAWYESGHSREWFISYKLLRN